MLVNTIPKAGTYLAALALENAGYSSKQLHLSDRFLHDNRSVPEDQIHWNPDSRRVNYRADYAASILDEGEFCVGHVSRQRVLDRAAAYNVHVLNIVRDPITQIWSFYRFQQKKTKPTPHSSLWRTMVADDGFKGYLLSIDMNLLLKHAKTLMSNGPFFCFEDMKQGKFIERALDPNTIKPRNTVMAQQRARVIRDVETGLASAVGKKTSTYIPKSENDKQSSLEDSAVVAFFDACGLTAASEFYKSSVLCDKTILSR
ncbi:hypothetical protein [Ruegeria sp.]|uniref:hypothetical protein n=1 Tax=Ruegeria sp. TaxID=1879320 RepID=UPI002327DA3E|nr:hypothetical protein [Ruegeria sp.]MDA7966336.1 hypothetical protein [Ruegeria sp.]